MLQFMKDAVKRLPYIRRLHRELAEMKTELQRWRTWQPPGHFYSPIPSIPELQADRERIFPAPPPLLAGLDMNVGEQLALLNHLGAFHSELPAQWRTKGAARYCFDNEYYSWADAIVLYSMLRHQTPRRLVEVGSGFSSAVVLDTDQMFLNRAIDCTFIDPFPQRLHGLLREDDRGRCRVISRRLQDVDTGVFAMLEEGDILLVDSSHVSKTGSDVNRLLFEILPTLARGVRVHFHDVFYPFEYPESWVTQGVAWNEAYMLRAFLQFNEAFSIQFFTSFLMRWHRDAVSRCLPLALCSERDNPSLADAPGSSLWLVRN